MPNVPCLGGADSWRLLLRDLGWQTRSGITLMCAFLSADTGGGRKVGPATGGWSAHIRGDKDGRGDMSAVDMSQCLVIHTQAHDRCKARTFHFAEHLALLSAGEIRCYREGMSAGARRSGIGNSKGFWWAEGSAHQFTADLLCKKCQQGRRGPGRSSGILDRPNAWFWSFSKPLPANISGQNSLRHRAKLMEKRLQGQERLIEPRSNERSRRGPLGSAPDCSHLYAGNCKGFIKTD